MDDFEIDEKVLQKAQQRDFLRVQSVMREREKIENILMCFKNSICPRCGSEQVMAEGGFSDRHYVIYRCAKCKFKYLDGE